MAFSSVATNLVTGDTNGVADVFVRDTVSGTTTRVSLVSGETGEGNGASTVPSISADGRYVAFTSAASNLVTGDTNAAADVFVRDTLTGVTRRLSIDTSGVQGNAPSDTPSINADGRYTAVWPAPPATWSPTTRTASRMYSCGTSGRGWRPGRA